MSGCGNCCGNCGGCGPLVLAEGEIAILRRLGEVAFLPVARRMDTDAPVYLEETDYPVSDYTLFLQCLEKRGLIRIDYDRPLCGACYEAYSGFPVRGSFGLTVRGQQVLELMEIQGIEFTGKDASL